MEKDLWRERKKHTDERAQEREVKMRAEKKTAVNMNKCKREVLYSNCSIFSVHTQTNDWHPNPLNTVQIFELNNRQWLEVDVLRLDKEKRDRERESENDICTSLRVLMLFNFLLELLWLKSTEDLLLFRTDDN